MVVRPEFLFLFFVLMVIAIAVYSFARIKQRRQDAAALAARLGFTYRQTDDVGITKLPHPIFRLGDRRVASNLAQGTAAGYPIVLFDYEYVESHTDANGHQTSTTYPFSGVKIDLPIESAPTVIRRERVSTKLANALGIGRDIQFESDGFNRAFEVRSESQEFAFTLIDTAMMEWLQSNGSDLDLQFHGGTLIAMTKQRPWSEMEALLARVIGFVERFPRLVWASYGTTT